MWLLLALLSLAQVECPTLACQCSASCEAQATASTLDVSPLLRRIEELEAAALLHRQELERVAVAATKRQSLIEWYNDCEQWFEGPGIMPDWNGLAFSMYRDMCWSDCDQDFDYDFDLRDWAIRLVGER